MRKRILRITFYPNQVFINRGYSCREYRDVPVKNLLNLIGTLRHLGCPSHTTDCEQGFYLIPSEAGQMPRQETT